MEPLLRGFPPLVRWLVLASASPRDPAEETAGASPSYNIATISPASPPPLCCARRAAGDLQCRQPGPLATWRVPRSPMAPLVLLLALAGPLVWAQGLTPSRFARVEGRELIGPDGAPLRLKGINLGNWLVPEGYMWRFQKGPQSPRQIQELVAELIGPDAARSVWRDFRAAYVTRSDIR
jgi:hypothetical protein